MKIRKTAAIVLSIALMAALAGCSSKNTEPETTAAPETEATTAAPTVAETEATEPETEETEEEIVEFTEDIEDSVTDMNVILMTVGETSADTGAMAEYMDSTLTGWGANVTLIESYSLDEIADDLEDAVLDLDPDAVVFISVDSGEITDEIEYAGSWGIPVFGCDSEYADGMELNVMSSTDDKDTELIAQTLCEQLALYYMGEKIESGDLIVD